MVNDFIRIDSVATDVGPIDFIAIDFVLIVNEIAPIDRLLLILFLSSSLSLLIFFLLILFLLTLFRL
jgi:hypothetical protein